MASGNGDNGVKISRATLALVLAIAGPTTAAGIAQYRIGQLETQRVETEARYLAQHTDEEARLRALEIAVTRFEATTEAVQKQTAAIEGLQQQVSKLGARLP